MPPSAARPIVLRSRLLSAVPGLLHGFGTRSCGLSRAGVGPTPRGRLLLLRQIHSTLIWADPEPGRAGDGMMTRQPGRLLAIRTADCCPILIADPCRGVVAAVHAGWRGTLGRIAEKAVGEMRARFGSDPGDLLAALGPSIRRCCYEVGPEVQQAFRARFDYADDLFEAADDDPVHNRYPMLFLTGAPPGHPYDPRWNPAPKLRLDLAQALARQLQMAGLPTAAIEVLPECTACQPGRFYSHRRGDRGRLLSAIGMQY